MSDASIWEMGWKIWCLFAAVAWPCTWMFGGKKSKPLTLEEKWAIFRELADTPQLMADGRTLQRIEWKYVLHVPEAVEAPMSSAPPTIARGRQPVIS